TNRIIALTAAGQILLQESRRVMAEADRALSLTPRAGAGAIGSLRIGVVGSAMRHLLPPILARFRVRYPDVLVELTEATTAQQLAGLLSDSMDLGLVIRPI